MSKADDMYAAGMARAYEIVKVKGLEVLEAEIRNRGVYKIPAGTTSYQVRAAARQMLTNELKVVALAMATTLTDDLNLPPTVIMEYLRSFNERCDLFRLNPEEFEKASDRLESKYALNETIKKFVEEE